MLGALQREARQGRCGRRLRRYLSLGCRSTPDVGPLAWQPVPVEPIAHGGRMHAKLAGDLATRLPPAVRTVGQVRSQRREAEFGCPDGQPLIGGVAALACGGSSTGWWGQAGVVEQAAGNHCGDAKLAGQPF